ncbi:MAG: branched chain amino acid aminotransferase [Desulfobulbus propionicus]|nr:MAG: branched chain amino acid aminotransferase [Desulfobulbus propionicus]
MLHKEFEIAVNKVPEEQRKEKPAQDQLGFGQYYADHMFSMRWNREHGWHDAQIQPYANIALDPAAMVFHYGQAIFEGMKVYRSQDGHIFLFRPQDNFARMNQSALRMCMPRFPEEKVLQALKALVYLDQDWVPSEPGATLYVRPTMIATEPHLGLRAAEEYLFYIINSPVGAYYSEGFSPTRIYVEETSVRAVPGGVGFAKTSGNYAASLKAQVEAHEKGFTQVLWLDAIEHTYIEEVGTSNIFFVINDVLITPPLGGSILPGVTRDSVIELAREWDIPVEERRLSIVEVIKAAEDGSLQESFGTGTAAVISPIGELNYRAAAYTIGDGRIGPLAQRFYDAIQGIQFGAREDTHEWVVSVC